MDEIWKPVPGYEGVYDVSDMGRVRSRDRRICQGRNKTLSLRRGRILKASGVRLNKAVTHLYRRVNLSLDGVPRSGLVSQLVATVFVPNPHRFGYVVHANADTCDDRAQNLAWSPNPAQVIVVTIEAALSISSLKHQGYSCPEIAAMKALPYKRVYDVASGRTWSNVTGIKPGPVLDRARARLSAQNRPAVP